jgi:putative hydrolase of the HAD superfamily
LIIFDLDDTLIDTSGSITPFKFRKVLEVLLGRVPSYLELEELLAINEDSSRSYDAIEQFARIKKIAGEVLSQALREMTAPLPAHFSVSCTPNAKQILEIYRNKCPIALVTGGIPSFQREKMEKAGIEASLFSKIAIPEDSVKKPFYEVFMREFSANPMDVWVCGDRIPMDLAPANELGFHTIHMQWGRGRRVNREPWVEYAVSDLNELRNIIP